MVAPGCLSATSYAVCLPVKPARDRVESVPIIAWNTHLIGQIAGIAQFAAVITTACSLVDIRRHLQNLASAKDSKVISKIQVALR